MKAKPEKTPLINKRSSRSFGCVRKRAMVMAIPFMLAASLSFAVEFKKTESYTLGREEVLEQELWLLADTVALEGTVQDDIFFLARTAVLSGSFESDTWGIADSLTYNGKASQDVRMGAGRLCQVNGTIARNLMAGGGTVSVGKEASIGGDAILTGENVIFEGKAKRAIIVAQQVTISGQTEGSLRLIAEDIVFLPGAVIGGDLVYTSSKDLVIDPKQVALAGELRKSDWTTVSDTKPQSKPWTQSLMLQVYFGLGALFAGGVWIWLFPGIAGRSVHHLRASFWRSGLIGLLAFCLVPMLAFFLFFTLIGIPLAILVAAGYVIMMYLAKIVMALGLGAAFMHLREGFSFGRIFSALALGILILYVLALLPVLDVAIWVFATVWGMGALVSGLFHPRLAGVVQADEQGISRHPESPARNKDNSNKENESQDGS